MVLLGLGRVGFESIRRVCIEVVRRIGVQVGRRLGVLEIVGGVRRDEPGLVAGARPPRLGAWGGHRVPAKLPCHGQGAWHWACGRHHGPPFPHRAAQRLADGRVARVEQPGEFPMC